VVSVAFRSSVARPAGSNSPSRSESGSFARANGLDPFEYLSEVFEQLPLATTVEAIEALLPWNLKPVLDARCNRQKPASQPQKR
jgi:hypothetical protein